MVRGDCFEVLFLSSLLYRYQYPLFLSLPLSLPFGVWSRGRSLPRLSSPDSHCGTAYHSEQGGDDCQDGFQYQPPFRLIDVFHSAF